MQQETRRKLLYLLPIIGLAIVVLTYFFWPSPETEALRKPLAQIMQIEEELVHLNMPPAVGRYPGTIIIRPKKGSALVVRQAEKPQGEGIVSQIVLTSNLSGTSQFESNLDPFSAKARSNGDFTVEVELKQLKVLEYAGGVPALRESLLTDKEVLRQRELKNEPEVVVRAVEAVPTFVVKMASGISAEVWKEKVDDFSLRMGATFDDRGRLVITTSEPVVVAYETQFVSYVTESMAPGAPKKVQLSPALAYENDQQLSWMLTESKPSKDSGLGLRTRIGFAVIGNGQYQNQQLGDLPAAINSVVLVKQTLKSLGAIPIGENISNKLKWTKDEVFNTLKEIVAEAKVKGVEGLIFYYVGHSAISSNSNTYLFMADYKGNISKITGGEIDSALRDNSSIGVVHEAGEWMEAANAMAHAAEPVSNTVNIDEIHDLLKELHAPFAVVIDGCSVRNTSSQLDYFLGFDLEAYANDEEQKIGLVRILQRYGVSPILGSDNVTIFAQRSGAPTYTVKHPYWNSFGPEVGPLAAALFKKALEIRPYKDEYYYYWGHYLKSIVDFEGNADWKKTGSVSWSDFSTWEEIPFYHMSMEED